MRLFIPALSSVLALTLVAAPVVATTPKKPVTKAHHISALNKLQASQPKHQLVKPATDDPAITGRNADGTLHQPVLADAPKDDFLRVAWCHGVLSGDMELAEMISSIYPKDEQLTLIGNSYLRAYEAALTLSGQGKDEAEHQQAEDARQYGYDQWAAARKAPLKEAAGDYATWQLPGDCEHAATRLSGHPNLFAEMATDDEVEAIAAVMSSGGPHDYKDMPKPILTGQKTPVATDGAISTNTLGRRANQSADLPVIPQTPATDAVTTTPETPIDPNHVEKRSWSDGLGYRLGWSNVKKKSASK